MRAFDVAQVIIERFPRLGQMKLQKLMYYSHAWHLAITGSPLVDDLRFKAWTGGPVIPDVWHSHRQDSSRSVAKPHAELDPSVAWIVEMVLDQYGTLSGQELSELTHVEEPWLEARGGIAADAPSTTPLSDEHTARFYRRERSLRGQSAAAWSAAPPSMDEDGEAVGPTDIDGLIASILDENSVELESALSAMRSTDLDGIDYSGIRGRSTRSSQ